MKVIEIFLDINSSVDCIHKELTDKDCISNWFFPLSQKNKKNKFNIENGSINKLYSKGELEVRLDKNSSSIIWSCQFISHTSEIIFNFNQKDKLKIKINLKTKLHINHFEDIYQLLFYRLLFKINNEEKLTQDLSVISNKSDVIEIEGKIKSDESTIYNILTLKKSIRRIFAKYPEVNFKEFIYTWGWIDEGPSNMIHYEDDKLLVHDFYLNYEPIGVVKWKIRREQNNNVYLKLIFQDIILLEETNPESALYSYWLGWQLLFYKVKDYAENGNLTVIMKTN